MNEPTKIDPKATHQVREHKHDRPLVSCRWDPQGRYIAFGAEDHLVHVFDLAASKATALAAHDSWVRAIGFAPDGTWLFSGGYDGRLAGWPLGASLPDKPQFVVEAHDGWLRALAVSPDGRLVATCGNDRLVKLFRAADGSAVAELSGHESHVYHLIFAPDGKSLFSCDLKGQVKQWDVEGGKLVRDLPAAAALYKYDTSFRADIGGARSIAITPDGKLLALGGITNVTNAFAGVGNAVIVLIDLAEGKLARTLQPKEKVNGTMWGVARHPAGFWIGLAGGGGGGWLYFFDDSQSEEFFKFKLPSDGRDLGVAPDASQVAVAHADRTLRLYGLYPKG